MSQLVLDLAGGPSFAPEDFLPAPGNREALGWIERWPDWPGFGLALWGPGGSGKSHLAQILAARAGGGVLAAEALVGRLVPELARLPLAAVEDADGGVDEGALLHLFNLLRERGGQLLLTARRPPARWAVALADLRSRLATLPTVAIAGVDDALLRAVLVKLFADRRLAPESEVIDTLLARMERSLATARAVVAELDRASLARQRPVTTALAREVLAGLSPPEA